MNIVHFAAGRINPSAAKDGASNVIYWLARAQSLAGHHVTIVVLPKRTDFPNAQDPNLSFREYRRPSLAGFAIDRKLFRDIDSGNLPIDIAHLHGLWGGEMVAVGSGLRRRGIPYVMSSHGGFGSGLRALMRVRKLIFRRVFGVPLANHAAFIHVHSQGEVQAARDYGVRRNLVIAEQGVNVDDIPLEPRRDWFSRNFPNQEKTFKIVYLGRLDPWNKGIDELLRGLAIALRTRPDISLFLIGPEKRRYRTEIPTLIAELGIGDRVIMPGPLYAPEEKYGALASADCFILPSRSEGFPLTVLEAMGCGTPVIVSAETNTGGVVCGCGAGMVCEISAEGIAHCLLAISSDPAAQLEMRANARRGAEKYTWARSAGILLEAYKTVERDR